MYIVGSIRPTLVAVDGKAETSNVQATSLVSDRTRTVIGRIEAIMDEASALAMSVANALGVDHARLSRRYDVSSDCSVATSTYSSSGMPQSGSISTCVT